jgi:hypothetical protein
MHRGLVAVLLVMAPGCIGQSGVPAHTPRPALTATPASSVAQRAESAPHEPTTEAERTALSLARAAEACPFDPVKGFEKCVDVDRWEAESDLFTAAGGDDALVWLLEHGSERARALAASKLHSGSYGAFRTDPALAARVLRAAHIEGNEAVGIPLGRAICDIDLTVTRLGDQFLAVFASTRNRGLAASMLESAALNGNPPHEFAVMLNRGADDPRPELRRAAADGFSSSQHVVRCAAWGTMLADTEISVAASAAQYVINYWCPDHWDQVLSLFEGWVKVGATDHSVPHDLFDLCRRVDLRPAQIKRATALAKQLAVSKLSPSVREEALNAVMSCDPAGSRFVGGFTSDPDVGVRAREVLNDWAAWRKGGTHATNGQ